MLFRSTLSDNTLCLSTSANADAFSAFRRSPVFVPIIIRLGYKLSWSDLPSLRNSGQYSKLDNVVIGVYRLVMKSHSANCRYSSVIDVIYELLRLNYSLVIFEPCDIDFSLWHNVRISENEDEFKKSVDIIIANRYDDNLTDFEGVVYTRDIFFRD